MSLDQATIDKIIASVDNRQPAPSSIAPPPQPPVVHAPRQNEGQRHGPSPVSGTAMGIFGTVNEAIAAASHAFTERVRSDADIAQIVEAIRSACRIHGEQLARDAHDETGLGRPEHKIIKNDLVTEKTPGPEDLDTQAITGDDGLTMIEYAPYGVIGSITPTTNPTSTIINNAIAMVAGGNAVVFNVHPSARQVSVDTVRILNKAIVSAGGPENLVVAIDPPTLQTAKDLMHHPDIALLLVTGGPGVVAEALSTTKKAVTAGPGNPPTVVDETADIDRAGRDIVRGASFDNNVICTDEKTTIVVDTVADSLIAAMQRAGARLISADEWRLLEPSLFPHGLQPAERNQVNASWIGWDAARILGEVGITCDQAAPLAIVELPNDHPLVWSEQLMPIMPITRVHDVNAAIDLAARSEHGYRHTASMHSSDMGRITAMARRMNCSIFVANGPNFAGLGSGGEGYTSFSIASPTGEGLTRPRTFCRARRVTLVNALNIV